VPPANFNTNFNTHVVEHSTTIEQPPTSPSKAGSTRSVWIDAGQGSNRESTVGVGPGPYLATEHPQSEGGAAEMAVLAIVAALILIGL
jgi:hypothetical protein